VASMGPPDSRRRRRSRESTAHRPPWVAPFQLGPPTLRRRRRDKGQDNPGSARPGRLQMGPPTLVDGDGTEGAQVLRGRHSKLQWGRRLSSTETACLNYGREHPGHASNEGPPDLSSTETADRHS